MVVHIEGIKTLPPNLHIWNVCQIYSSMVIVWWGRFKRIIIVCLCVTVVWSDIFNDLFDLLSKASEFIIYASK